MVGKSLCLLMSIVELLIILRLTGETLVENVAGEAEYLWNFFLWETQLFLASYSIIGELGWRLSHFITRVTGDTGCLFTRRKYQRRLTLARWNGFVSKLYVCNEASSQSPRTRFYNPSCLKFLGFVCEWTAKVPRHLSKSVPWKVDF